MALRGPTGRDTAFEPGMQAIPLPARGRHSIACSVLGVNPRSVRLVEGRAEFEELSGYPIGEGTIGMASPARLAYWTDRVAGIDTHVHELLHILFPNWPHEAVYYWAAKLSGARHVGVPWCPPRTDDRETAEILRLARESARLRGVAL